MNEIRCKEIKRGKSPTYITNSNIFVFAQKCNSKYNGIDLSLCKCLDPAKFRNYDRSEVMLPGDIIINSTGTGTLGRIGYLSGSDNINNLTLVPDSHVTVVRLSNELNSYFMKVTVDLYHKYFEEHGEGSTNQKELKPLTIQTILVPIPPRNEQNRIVNKLKELNPLIEKYKLAEEKLYELNSNIKNQLKKSILQYAIEGKLVPQDPNDEPASVLLDRIRKEKQALIAEGKIKKDKNESIIYRRDNSYYEKLNGIDSCIDDEIPFTIPQKWSWIRLKNISTINMGTSPIGDSISGNNENGFEFHQGKIFFGDKYLNRSNVYTTRPIKFAEENSLLLCVRAPVGKLNITRRNVCIGRGLCTIKPYGNIRIEFLYYFLLTYEKYFAQNSTGSTFKAITSNVIFNCLFPLPSLDEQNKIIKTIEKVYSILK